MIDIKRIDYRHDITIDLRTGAAKIGWGSETQPVLNPLPDVPAIVRTVAGWYNLDPVDLACAGGATLSYGKNVLNPNPADYGPMSSMWWYGWTLAFGSFRMDWGTYRPEHYGDINLTVEPLGVLKWITDGRRPVRVYMVTTLSNMLGLKSATPSP